MARFRSPIASNDWQFGAFLAWKLPTPVETGTQPDLTLRLVTDQ